MKIWLPISVLLFTAGGFYFSNMITPAPGSSSGNGNPAILLVCLLPIIFIYLILFWRGINVSLSTKVKWYMSIAGALYCIAAAVYGSYSFLQYVETMRLGYEKQFGYVDEDYIQDISSLLSIHVNNQFFNLNTFLLFVALTFVIGIWVPARVRVLKS